MKIKIGADQVTVLDEKCQYRDCFQLFRDQGTFVQGRGYTRYHANPVWVCGQNHLHGCPYQKPEPLPENYRCCPFPAYPKKRARSQKCRTCGKRLSGDALDICRALPDLPGHSKCRHENKIPDSFLDRKYWVCSDCGGYVLDPSPFSETVDFDFILAEGRRKLEKKLLPDPLTNDI